MHKVRLSIRVDLPRGRFGPGKAALLRTIADSGSISAAARSLGMSYTRAWSLTDDMNGLFGQPLVEAYSGGNRRGGARLTASGAKVLSLYDEIAADAEHRAARKLAKMAAVGRQARRKK